MYVKEVIGGAAMAAGLLGTVHYAGEIYDDLQHPVPAGTITVAQYETAMAEDINDLYKATGTMTLMAAGTVLWAWSSAGRLRSVTLQARSAYEQHQPYGA